MDEVAQIIRFFHEQSTRGSNYAYPAYIQGARKRVEQVLDIFQANEKMTVADAITSVKEEIRAEERAEEEESRAERAADEKRRREPFDRFAALLMKLIPDRDELKRHLQDCHLEDLEAAVDRLLEQDRANGDAAVGKSPKK